MTVLCSGLSPLLNLCASGILKAGDSIDFLQYVNTYDSSRFRSSSENTLTYAEDICASLGYKLRAHGPFNWYCPPAEERSATNNIEIEVATGLNLSKDVIITANSEMFVAPLLRSRNIGLFPEGASCFPSPTDKRQPLTIRSTDALHKLASRVKWSCLGFPYKITKRWLLNNIEGDLTSVYARSSLWEPLKSNILFSNYRKAIPYFKNKYPAYCLDDIDDLVFHPFLEFLSEADYGSWVTKNLGFLGSKNLFIKTRPRAAEATSTHFFDNIPVFSVSTKLNELPAELFIHQKKMHYFGMLSSTMLSFPRNRIHLDSCPDEGITKRNLDVYAGLSKAFDFQSLFDPGQGQSSK